MRVLSELAWQGTRIELTPAGTIRLTGTPITDEQRATILLHRDLVVRLLRLDQGVDSGHSLGAAETL